MLWVGLAAPAHGGRFWDGGKPEDNFFTSNKNWNNNDHPDFNDTSLELVFGNAGIQALLDRDVSVASFLFNRDFTVFTLGGYTVSLTSGLTVQGSSDNVVLHAPIEVADRQTWEINGTFDLHANLKGSYATVRKTGDGTMTFLGSDFWQGNLTIDAGTLRVGNGGTAGTLQSDLWVGNQVELIVDRYDDWTYNGYLLSGHPNWTIRKRGAGTLTVTNLSYFEGETIVEHGTLRIESDYLGDLNVQGDEPEQWFLPLPVDRSC